MLGVEIPLRQAERNHFVRNGTLIGAFACILLASQDVRASSAHTHSTHGEHGGGYSTRHKHLDDAGGLRVPHDRTRSGNEANPPPLAGIVPLLFSSSGLASVYSGGRTASNERMNAGAMTAAHRTLPFGTRVTVVNNRNGRAVVVRINDRGPFVRGRIIDLSPAAARAIGVTGLSAVLPIFNLLKCLTGGTTPSFTGSKGYRCA
jgi:rare lipoprotein A